VHDDSDAQPLQLGPLELSKAPDAPGLYAWYAQLGLTDQDWEPDPQDGVDRAAGYLTSAVREYARIHEPRTLHLNGTGTYQLPWTGMLKRSSIADSREGGEDTAAASRLGELAADPAVRRLLISLLRRSTPVFASPLYIGVTDNLRMRLSKHMKDYEAAKNAFGQNPSLKLGRQFEGKTFGERLAASGLQLNYLQCWILPAKLHTQDENSSASVRDVTDAAEWILQRIFLPVLGRQ
jgi:hypothetical protein